MIRKIRIFWSMINWRIGEIKWGKKIINILSKNNSKLIKHKNKKCGKNKIKKIGPLEKESNKNNKKRMNKEDYLNRRKNKCFYKDWKINKKIIILEKNSNLMRKWRMQNNIGKNLNLTKKYFWISNSKESKEKTNISKIWKNKWVIKSKWKLQKK